MLDPTVPFWPYLQRNYLRVIKHTQRNRDASLFCVVTESTIDICIYFRDLKTSASDVNSESLLTL